MAPGHVTLDRASDLTAFVEPSTLHKYSNDMRESKFTYLDEEEDTLTPSFNFTSQPSSKSNSRSVESLFYHR